MAIRDRLVAKLTAVRSAWQRRSPDTTGIIVSAAVLAAVIYGGGILVGLSLPVPGLNRPAAAVALDAPIPAITKHADVHLTGMTRPGSSITALVDQVTELRTVTGDGRFDLTLTLPSFGAHSIRLEVRYGGRRVDELLETTVHWVPATDAPRLLAVEWWPEFGGYYLLVSATPGSSIEAQGASLERLDDRTEGFIGPSGRAEYLMTADGSTMPTLTAIDPEGGVSPSTAPLDLPALVADPPPVPAADQVMSTVTFAIDRRDVVRTWTAELDPHRIELADLTTGTIDARSFLSAVTGPAGIAPLGSAGCLIGTIRSGAADLEIGADTSTVTLVDSFPGVVTQWNGFSDSPGVSLCLPRGMPARRDSGYVEVRVQGFVFQSVSIPPTSAMTMAPVGGPVERVYRWDRIPFATRLDIRLGPESPSVLSLVPRLEATADSDFDDGRLRFLDALVWRFLRSLGTLLFLGIAVSPLGSGLGARAPFVRNVAVVTLAITLAPAFGRLDLAALELSNFPLLLRVDDGVVRLILAEWINTILVVLAATVAWWTARRWSRTFWQAVALAVVLAGLGWLAATAAAGIATFLMAADGAAAVWVRLLTWLTGLVVITTPLAYLWAELGRIGDPSRPRPSRSRMIRWVVGAAIGGALLSLPAGVEGTIGSTPIMIWTWTRASLASLASLAGFIVTATILVTIVLVARGAWRSSRATAVDDADPPPPAPAATSAARLGETTRIHLLPALACTVFAGFAISTAGGLQPLSFAFALMIFGIVWLRPLRSTAPALGYAAEPATSSTSAGSPAWSVWANVRFALGCGLVLALVPLVLFIAQYPLAGVSRSEPLYLQHVLVTLGSFSLSWLFLGLSFGLGFEHLPGSTGLRKGLLLGVAVLLVTVPFQALNGILTVFSPLELAIWVFDVVAFATLLGAAFDLRAANAEKPLDFFRPDAVLKTLGEQSGVPAVATGLGVVLATVATTAFGLITNQIVQIVTQVLTPFLPVPPA